MPWVKGKGGVRRWEGPMIENTETDTAPRLVKPTPIERRKSPRTGSCIDCRRNIERRTVRCIDCHKAYLESNRGPEAESPESAIADIIDRLSRNLRSRPLLGTTCADCGCLLVDPSERCPACLVWAELNVSRASWLLAERTAA